MYEKSTVHFQRDALINWKDFSRHPLAKSIKNAYNKKRKRCFTSFPPGEGRSSAPFGGGSTALISVSLYADQPFASQQHHIDHFQPASFDPAFDNA